jgi:hypothetical protein
MEMPAELDDAAGAGDEIMLQERTHDDESHIVVDFGPLGGTPSLDVVGDATIVVVGDEQYEFQVPDDASDVSANGSVLTIRG